jgi:hypothetical protein
MADAGIMDLDQLCNIKEPILTIPQLIMRFTIQGSL